MRISDWSSDVCSSDVDRRAAVAQQRRDDAADALARTGRRDGDEMPLAREQDRQRGAAGGVDLIAEAEADRAAVAARFERPHDEQPISLDRLGMAESRRRLRAELGPSAAHALTTAAR